MAPNRIREARPDDIEALASIDPITTSDSKRRDAIGGWLTTETCLVAESADGEVIGFVALSHDFFDQGFVRLVFVSQGHRRVGLGMELLASAELRCHTSKLFTSTNASNVSAQALFERAGFVRSGVVENLDEGDPEIVYFKRVTRI